MARPKVPLPLADALALRLSLAASLALAGHVQHLPLWVTGGYLATLLWFWVSLAWPRLRPGAPLRVLLASLAAFAILAEFNFGLGRNSGVTLLVALLGFKLLEMRHERDAYMVLFLAYFSLTTLFFYWQDFAAVLYLIGSALLLTAALVDLNHPGSQLSLRAKLGLGGVLLLQSAPLAVVLFVLFPRLDTPLWAMPAENTAASGLSDRMSPGRISQLILSTAIAFRVKFEGDIPPSAVRYFRGPVLWHTDGITWSAPVTKFGHQPPKLENLELPLRYTVTLEPHQQNWLLAMDWVAPDTPQGVVQRDTQLVTTGAVRERRRYEVLSYLRGQNLSLKSGERVLYTQLPESLNPEVTALAARWPGDNAETVVQAALRHFRDQGFSYTLQPPLLGSDPVGEFLFKTRRGFCEHYAAALTTLLRTRQIPARVVTGYLGGEINPLDETLVVRQADAHAWVEVWSEARGWFRVDPTAVVAPERLENSLSNRVAAPDGLLRFNLQADWMRQIWRQAGFGWDAMNNAWHQWVMGYTEKRQQNLLAEWGLDSRHWQQLSFVMALGISLAGMIMGAWVLWRRPLRRPDPVLALYQHYCQRLARRGLPRAPQEGPQAYCMRISRQQPELSAYVNQVTALYLPLRYGNASISPAALAQLRATVRQPLPTPVAPPRAR